jgi:hypothetical protein
MFIMNTTIDKIVGLVNFDLNPYTDREFLYSQFGHTPEERLSDVLKVALESTTYINDHKSSDNEEKFEGFVVLRNGHVCLIFKSSYFCLNRMYVDKEGKLHLSTGSVAGNVITAGTTVEKAIEKYNSDLIESMKNLYGKDVEEIGTLIVYTHINNEERCL